jgi:transposase
VLILEQFELIRRMVLIDGLSVRQVARQLNHSRKTIRKALEHSAPIPYRVDSAKPRPKLDPFVETIRAWLTDDLRRPRKQRHTAVRIWERLRDEHQYDGARRAVSWKSALKMDPGRR